MQCLGEADRFPPLPDSVLTLLRNERADSDIVAAMDEAIRDAVGRPLASTGRPGHLVKA